MARLDVPIDLNGTAYQANRAACEDLLAELQSHQAAAIAGGPPRLVERHRKRGKLLARERIDLLLDDGAAFLELSTLAAHGQYGGEVPAAGVVTGIGTIAGEPVMIIANDATVKGGSFFHETVKKHARAQEIALENALPTVYLVDCGGAYLPEQDRVFLDKDHFGNSFYNQCRTSSRGLPQISAVFGSCTAGGAYIPALSDEVVMVRGNATIHLGGPAIVKAVIHEDADAETLGGAEMHTRVSGVSDYLAEDEPAALLQVREIMAKLNRRREPAPAVGNAAPPVHDPDQLLGIISTDAKRPYDARAVIARLVDASDFQEFKPLYGETLVCGTAAIHGHAVGILANNGVLFSASALKAAHFIELCDQRNIPLLFLQNITGYMVGAEAERGGIAKDSAKMVHAVACARVPRFTVLMGGSYGAGNYGMCGRGFRPRFLFAWPTARCATMSADVATTVLVDLRRKSLERGDVDAAELEALVAGTRAQFEEQSDPYYATSRLWDDGLIDPRDTRDVIGLCLSLAASAPALQPPAPVYRM